MNEMRPVEQQEGPADGELRVLREPFLTRLLFLASAGLVLFGSFKPFYASDVNLPIVGDLGASASFWDLATLGSEGAIVAFGFGLLLIVMAAFTGSKTSGALGVLGGATLLATFWLMTDHGMLVDFAVDAVSKKGVGYDLMQWGAIASIAGGVIRFLPTQGIKQDLGSLTSNSGSRGRETKQNQRQTPSSSTVTNGSGGIGDFSRPPQADGSSGGQNVDRELIDVIDFAVDRLHAAKREASRNGDERFYKWCAKNERKLESLRKKASSGDLRKPPAELESAIRQKILGPLKKRV